MHAHQENIPRKKIFWIGNAISDLLLSKEAEIESLQGLAESGYDVYLFAGQSKRRVKKANSNIHLIPIPLRYVPLISPFLYALAVLILLPFYIVTKKPNFIVMEPDLTTASFIWKTLLHPSRSKIILDIRSTPVEPDNFQGSLRTLRFNTSVAIAKKVFDGMTTLTDLMKQEICNKFYIDPRFIGVWTSGVSTALFKPENYDGVEIRKKLGLINKFIVFYHGSLSLYRGIEESIESIRILKKECDDIVLFLLGKSPRARDLLVIKELIQKSEVQDNVIIHSAVCYEDVPKYISMCDVGIVPLPDLPYWRYQCPLKLLEYLAMKKVVIVTDIPANREVIGESKCGIYVSSLDPEKIANAITYAYDNRDKLKEWGSDGRVIVEEKYSRNEVAKDLESFLLKG